MDKAMKAELERREAVMAERAARPPKPDADRFSGKPQINKIKPDNIALAGAHAAWAEQFAKDFTAALPSFEPGTMASWVVGVKVCNKASTTEPSGGSLFLRLKVYNGGKGENDKRRWLWVPLGSKQDPAALAAETAEGMAVQPHKRLVGPTGMQITLKD